MFPAQMKILIVDDSSFARVMLRNHLRDLGFQDIIEAPNVKEAQQILSSADTLKPRLGLIVSDINMPDITGLEFLRWVRSQPSLTGIPFVLLTASQDMEEIYEAGKLGVSHFVLKPLELKVLKERLAHVWKKHGEAYFKTSR